MSVYCVLQQFLAARASPRRAPGRATPVVYLGLRRSFVSIYECYDDDDDDGVSVRVINVRPGLVLRYAKIEEI